jgi:hypothetical protein
LQFINLIKTLQVCSIAQVADVLFCYKCPNFFEANLRQGTNSKFF